jgi:hypothetical protein
MSAQTSTNKATITRSIGRSPAGDVPVSRLARASCETRRNASLTGSKDPFLFAMPQIIAPFVSVLTYCPSADVPREATTPLNAKPNRVSEGG